MVLLIGAVVVLFVIALVLSEGPWGRRFREHPGHAMHTVLALD